MYKLSIIIPSFNEEENLGAVIEKILDCIKMYQLSVEILIIDDGSTDSTYEIAKKYESNLSNIYVIHHKVNRGFGFAFRTGVENAKGEYLVLIPGDDECDVDDLFLGVNFLGLVDLLIPFVVNKNIRNNKRQIISRIFTKIINFSFNTCFNYTNGSVIYKTSVIKKLNIKSAGFFFQTEIILRLVKSGYLYAEIPAFLSIRSSGISKALHLNSIFQVLIDYLKTFIGLFVTKNYIIGIDENSITYSRRSKLIKKFKS